MKSSHAPLLIAIVLLLLPLLYVGSYLALVRPGVDWMNMAIGSRIPDERYRVGGRFSEGIFWPVEQIDRRLRPGAWDWRLNDLPGEIDPLRH